MPPSKPRAAGVRLGWEVHDARVEIIVEDEGPGLGDTGNLFVPFFTTKSGGSGVGLVLSRQIAESHGGTLSLENQERRRRSTGARRDSHGFGRLMKAGESAALPKACEGQRDRHPGTTLNRSQSHVRVPQPGGRHFPTRADDTP